MKTKISEKGQVTVPKRLRERLGIRAGDELDWIEEGEGKVLVRKVLPEDTVASVYGILNLGRRTDDLINEMRGEPDAV